MISEEQKEELKDKINLVIEAEKELVRAAAMQFRAGIRLDPSRYEEAEARVTKANRELTAFIETLDNQPVVKADMGE